jgi:SAM-dependent methyltransferase
LARRADRLVAVDYHADFSCVRGTPGVSCVIGDVTRVDALFSRARFDLIVSSNLLEHLPDPSATLHAMRAILRDDGLMIHVIPTPLWKAAHLAGYLPAWCAVYLETLMRKDGWRILYALLLDWLRACAGRASRPVEHPVDRNNPLTAHRPRGPISRLFVPAPHGVSAHTLQEFAAFGVRRWKALFVGAGFRIAAIRRGPVTSGYGFGGRRIRALCARLGLSTETIYVLDKNAAAES